jgi:hypothetical protein
MSAKSSPADSQDQEAATFLKTSWTILNSSFFSVVIIGLVAWLYSSVWVPSAKEWSERRDLLFELYYRFEKAHSINSKLTEIIDGSNGKNIMPGYADVRFRDLAIRYAVLRGSDANDLRAFALLDVTQIATNLVAVQESIKKLVLAEGFNFQVNDSTNTQEQYEMSAWIWVLIGSIGVVNVVNSILLFIILFRLMGAALRPPARSGRKSAKSQP